MRPGSDPNETLPRPPEAPPIPRLNAIKLAFLLEQPTTTLALELATAGSGFRETIDRSSMPQDVVRLTLRCVAILCDYAPMRQHIADLLHIVHTVPIYWRHIVKSLQKLQSVKSTKPTQIATVRQFVADICKVASSLREEFATGLEPTMLTELVTAIGSRQELKPFADQLTAIRDESNRRRVPTSFIPLLVDLLDDKTEATIEPNHTDSAYRSVEHYIDVQMALVRQDFLRSVRDGLAAVRTGQATGALREHPETRIQVLRRKTEETATGLGDNGVDDGAGAEAVFAIRVTDESGQPLMVGALLMLTTDRNVSDLVLAVAAHTEPHLARDGYVSKCICAICF